MNDDIQVRCYSTVYLIGERRDYYRGRGHEDLIQVAVNNLKIFHERRYVDRPYKVPFVRPRA